MKLKLLQHKDDVFASFWLIPMLITLLAIVMAISLLFFDHTDSLSAIRTFARDYLHTSSATIMLATIATILMTMTSVTFSIIILIFSQLSNQFGHRLLPNFMRQNSTQVVLGIFIANFIYTLIILQQTSNTADDHYLPILSVLFAFLFTIVSIFAFIYIIYFVCYVIQIDNILKYLSIEVKHSIDRTHIQTEHYEQEKNMDARDCQQLAEPFKIKTNIAGVEAGYINVIDYEVLYTLANRLQCFIVLTVRAGNFMIPGSPAFVVYSHAPLEQETIDQLLQTVTVGDRRTLVQDIEFAFEQLSEVALVALSPGVNNSYTAVHCINRIVESLAYLARFDGLATGLLNKAGQYGLYRKVSTHDDIIFGTFNRLRECAGNDFIALRNMIKKIKLLLQQKLPTLMSSALKTQLSALRQSISHSTLAKHEQDYLLSLIEG